MLARIKRYLEARQFNVLPDQHGNYGNIAGRASLKRGHKSKPKQKLDSVDVWERPHVCGPYNPPLNLYQKQWLEIKEIAALYGGPNTTMSCSAALIGMYGAYEGKLKELHCLRKV